MSEYTMIDRMENGTVHVINESGIDNDEVFRAMGEQHPELAVMTRWHNQSHQHRGLGGLMSRDKYVTPHRIYDQMRVAQEAAESDNIVSGVLETTEALAFSRMSIQTWDQDEEDVWCQIIEDLDLDSRFREMWGELFTVSQFYYAVWWGTKSYKVRGRDPKTGVKRKRVFNNLKVPIAISLLDPLKVMPVGNMMFNQEQLCYIANRDEGHMISQILQNNRSDDTIITSLITGRYEANDQERRLIADLGYSIDSQLFLLNPEMVFRHTATKAQYRRFADVRLKSVFELLDLKQQLREMDRAHLLGATNFIVLVKKGDDKNPAKPAELDNLQNVVRNLARVPVIVGDHRLAVEIVTPKMDQTLDDKRHNMLDHMIAVRLFQQFVMGTGQGRSDDSIKMARVVARGLESRRYMLKRAFERQILEKVFERNEEFTDEPTLVFHPHQIALDFDVDLANYLLDLRDRGDVSRETILSQIDLDQDQEFQKRKEEKKNGYDAVFKTQVPFSTPAAGGGAKPGAGAATSPRTAGRNQGGNKSGGGAAGGKKAAASVEDFEEEDEE